MKNHIFNLSTSNAALVVGIAFIVSVIIVTIVDDFLLANFVIPGDTSALARDIEAKRSLFGFAVAGYTVVLILDSIIGLALYIVLKPYNKTLAFLTATFRLLYAGILIIGLIALVLEFVTVYEYALVKLLGYVFFALHIFMLGYCALRSGYIPKIIGVLLIIASFTYLIFFIDAEFPETLQIVFMIIMGSAELLLSIWLIIKRNSLPVNVI
ncbi:DUF4386 domain-containing protein [Aliikangiella marina]|uniref:DUF4386 domain-containing protein n=1 Tax=Aliikangiella marina TaxID=1712262 RepID=UPI00163DCF5C|nr:DUF4386 domain-containing protein [Aliikangiella marina]